MDIIHAAIIVVLVVIIAIGGICSHRQRRHKLEILLRRRKSETIADDPDHPVWDEVVDRVAHDLKGGNDHAT